MLNSIKITDYRHKLKRASWSIGKRKKGDKWIYITVHYNGPPVKGAGNPSLELAQLQVDSRWHTRAGAFGSKRGGDGLMYHGYTDCNGDNYQTRDYNDLLWHSGNTIGNGHSLAWHVPIGGDQHPTAKQLTGLFAVLEALRSEYGISYANIKGHKEWSKTDCPGDPLHSALVRWRTDKLQARPPGLLWYEAMVNMRVRTAPSVKIGTKETPQAMHNGVPMLVTAGTVFGVDQIVKGVNYEGFDQYVHRADQLGFMLLRPDYLRRVG